MQGRGYISKGRGNTPSLGVSLAQVFCYIREMGGGGGMGRGEGDREEEGDGDRKGE